MTQPAPVVLWRIEWRDGGGSDWNDWTAREFVKSRDLADETEVHNVTKGTWYPAALDPASKVAALIEERDTALKVADIATDAAAKAVLDAKEVYEARHLARIKAMGALLGDARKCVVLVNVNGYYDNWLVRLDAALAEREG